MGLVNIQNGESRLLWEDLWLGIVSSQAYPKLFFFAKNKRITLSKAKSIIPLHNLFHLPLSIEAFVELQQLEQDLQGITLTPEHDWWSYIWNSRMYKSTKAYRVLIGHTEIHLAFKWI